MRMKARWLAIFLVLGLVLAGCSPAEETTDTTEGGTTETTEPPTDTTEGGTTDTTEAPDTGGELVTDVGVDVENKVIRVGYLSDLSGPFAALVGAINAGAEFYWTGVNAAGGIDGWTVEMVVRDTGYDAEAHTQFYEELKTDTVMIAQSTGSPQTVGILQQLAADGVLAVPLTWYSGWSDETLNSNLLHHGMNYCVEAHNVLGYIMDNNDVSTLAIAAIPGDYGLDSAAGAALAATALGYEVVYDGTGAIVPGAEGPENPDEIANAIVAADPDVVFLTGRSQDTEAIYGLAVGQGLEAVWSGAFPTYSPRFIAPGSPIAEEAARDFVLSFYGAPWADGNPGIAAFSQAVLDAGLPASEFYTEGAIEATIVHRVLEAAIASGDLTQAGVLAAAKTLENVDLGGLGPNESYVGSMNDQLQRVSYIVAPDPADLAGGGTGFALLEGEYTHPVVADLDFTGACYSLG
jgi:ABC-type branched-subunit amino acid transport system substrate-binding protein